MPAAAPRRRTPAQIEASRRNGARSRGPVTEEGKAKASRNALKHGLTAMHHLVLEDEVPDALEALIATVAEETGATTEIESRLARRLAIALWKGERAERIEVALFDAAPKLRPPQTGFQWEEADPLTTFDVKRFNAIRGYQAQQGREISRCLKSCASSARTRSRIARTNPRACRKTNPEPARSRQRRHPPAPAARADPWSRRKQTRARPLGHAARTLSAPSSTGCWRPTTGRAWHASRLAVRCCRSGSARPTSPRRQRWAVPSSASWPLPPLGPTMAASGVRSA